MKLYSAALSMFGAKVEIALAEKHIAFKLEMVAYSFKTGYSPKHPEVLRINPKSQVPVMIGDDVELYDSTQIFEYLEHRYPEIPLWPAGPAARARARQLEHAADEVFFAPVIILMQRSAGHSKEKRQQAKAAIQAYYDQMDGLLDDQEFLGESFSYADIAFLMAHHHATLLGCDLRAEHDNLSAWRLRMMARPTVRKVLEPMAAFCVTQGIMAAGFVG